MFASLRARLLAGLAPLLAILVALGLWAVVVIARLGNNVDVLLRENYRSVLAAQTMKESLERLDSALLFGVGGRDDLGRAQFARYRPVFEESLRTELANITLPGEETHARRVAGLFTDYVSAGDRLFGLPVGSNERNLLYFGPLLRTFDQIKAEADAILAMNQANMEDHNDRARRAAVWSSRLVLGGVAVAVALGTVTALWLARSILGPVHQVTDAARAMSQGDYDQTISTSARDELGELASAFNTMARRLREFRDAGTARLVRAQQTAQATIDSFPDPVVVVDLAGRVERANPAASRVLRVHPAPDAPDGWNAPPPIAVPLARVLGGGPDELPSGIEHAFALRDQGPERFFLPRVVAIRRPEGPQGAAVVLQDVTRFRLVDQLKSHMVATVSHELRTPLTSIQMVVHLLLEESTGPLSSKQYELLLAARQDCDRLLGMVNDLLDLTRIEQGRLRLMLEPVSASSLIDAALGRAMPRAVAAGVDLASEAPSDLAPVRADVDRVAHVFDNLINNAIAHTPRGGRVLVSAAAGGEIVRFAVSDTGEGIAPEHLPQLFERFYRVPGARRTGAGLGLAIARDIVSAHGGQMEVSSTPGNGSVFQFTLPAVRS